MKKLPFIAVFLFLSFISLSQETNYTGLESKGEIPEEFTKHTTDKIKEAQAANANGLENVSKKTKNKFYEMSNFGIDELLQSGQVCFNDTISTYVDNVLEEIRSKNHTIPLNIRIYTIKSPVVNAYTTDQGIIFVNTGLLAQLENEAQLAFIICHELIHYMENHVRESFSEDVQISKRKNEYGKLRNVDKNLASAKFSRKLESEADIKGLELFLKTDYNPAEINGVFDVLLYAHLPFDEITFDSTILEIGKYQIPDRYFLTELNEIEVDDNEDDSKHTHPNIAKRRSKIDNLLAKESKTGKDFILPERDFYAVRGAARYEVLRLQLIRGKYSEALYSAFLLDKEYPNNPLPKIAIGEILFGTAMFANDKNRRKVTGYYKKKQGSVQQVYHLLSKLKSKEITLLAARYNMYLHQLHPENEVIENRIIDLFRDLVYYHDMEFEDINFQVVKQKKESNNEQEKAQSKPKTNSKYDRIKSTKSKKKSKPKVDTKWSAREIFAGCDCEDDVESYFEKGAKKSDALKYRLGETDDDELNAQSAKEQKDYRKKVAKKGRSLGIDKIVMVDPYYIVYRQNKKNNPYQLSKSEAEEIEQLNDFDIISEKANLEMEILTSYRFSSGDVDKFNDFSLMNEWINERFLMDDKTNYTSSSEEVKQIVNHYGTKYFAWTGVVNMTSPRSNKGWVTLLSIYSILGIPYGIYYLATPLKSTTIYFALFNIETGQLVMYENREIPLRDSDGLLMSHYYDMFNQIKK